MNFFSYSLLSLVVLFASCDPTAKQIELQKTVYKTAMENGDLNTATTAVYQLVELEPTKAWKDTLLGVYFGRGAYVQTVLLGEKLLEGRENDTTLLEYLAFSKEALGMFEESLKAYKKLYEDSKELNHLYQIASLQFNLRRYNECVSSLNKITQDPKAESTKVSIRYGRGETQEVPVMAAVFNINGVLAMQQKDFKSAEASFQKALQIFPDFALAKGNIQAMAQSSEQEAMEEEG
jgi:tetratricopeptide (TPR) repeat protein